MAVQMPPILKDSTGQSINTTLGGIDTSLGAIITALQALSAPSATNVAVSPTGLHYITEDDAQGALAELDETLYNTNASLTQLDSDFLDFTHVYTKDHAYYHVIRIGRVIFLQINADNVNVTSGSVLTTLDDIYRPRYAYNTINCYSTASSPQNARIIIQDDGKIQPQYTKTGDYIRVGCCYIGWPIQS